jgi:TRAP-type C4-dicarboxylate transport system permease small subunit
LIDRLTRALRLCEDAALVLALSAMIGVAAYQVIARNFFDTGLLWGDSFVRVLVLWVTFVGAMVASRQDEHIRMDLLARYLKPARRALLVRFRSLFAAVIAGLFTYFSAEFVLLDYEDGITAFAKVPAWICELIMPVGGAVITLRYLLHTIFPPPEREPLALAVPEPEA